MGMPKLILSSICYVTVVVTRHEEEFTKHVHVRHLFVDDGTWHYLLKRALGHLHV